MIFNLGRRIELFQVLISDEMSSAVEASLIRDGIINSFLFKSNSYIERFRLVEKKFKLAEFVIY